MAYFPFSKILLLPVLTTTVITLTACQSASTPVVLPTTPLPKTVVAMPMPEVILPKVITPTVVETLMKDPTPPKAVIDGNIALEVQTITPAYLASYHWKLVKATDSDNKEILPLMDKQFQSKLDFYLPVKNYPQFSLNFTMSCNKSRGDYTLADNVLVTSNLSTTLMSCGDTGNKAENQLFELMQGTSQLSMRKGDIPFLTQITEHNSTLVWQGTQTARSRYAQEPEIAFLAISPDTKFCDDKTTRQCLQIKPVTYVDNKKVVTGDWLLLDGAIEGYTHNPDLAQVIRVERYTVATDKNGKPSKAKPYVYVLDQVIESAVVNKQ